MKKSLKPGKTAINLSKKIGRILFVLFLFFSMFLVQLLTESKNDIASVVGKILFWVFVMTYAIWVYMIFKKKSPS
ncbi:MAG: hypothetical protein ACOYMB_04675 [Patescibacteria group bacterium]